MPVNRNRGESAYGLTNPLQNLSPIPIVAQRAPTTTDFAVIGTTWVDVPNDSVYVITSITSNSANWATSPASGVGTFTSVTVNPGNVGVTAGDVTISLGNLNVLAGNTTLAGNLSVAGVLSFTGDLDLTSAALIDLTSTLNAAPSILLRANGGVNEQVRIHADQGTSVNSVELDSDVGGITLVSGLASADAINLEATAGGIDIDSALQINIASSQNAAGAIALVSSAGGMTFTATGTAGEDMVFTNSASIISVSSESVADAVMIEASGAAGGVQVSAGTAGILIGNQADCLIISAGDFAPTASRTITVGGGTIVTAAVTDIIDIGPDGATTNANSIKTVNIGSGGVTLGENNVNIGTGNRTSGTHLVAMSTGTGTKTVNIGNADGLTTINIDAICLINDSINVATSINTGTSTGAIAIGNSAAGAVTVDTAAGISIDGATASNFTVTGAGIDLTLNSVGGSVLVSSTENAALAIRLHANGGVTETIQLHSDQGTGVGSVNILSDVGGITLTATGLASADAINLEATAGGIDADAALQINVASSQAAADALRFIASNAGGGIDIDSGTTGITIDSTGAISLDAAAASNFTATGAGIDLTLASVLGSVLVSSTENAALAIRLYANGGVTETIQLHSDQGTGVGSINLLSDVGGITFTATGLASADAINLEATAGGVDIDAALQINIASSQNAVDSIVINSTAGGIDILASGATAGEDIDIIATGSSVNITATEAIVSAIVISASNAAGGINLDTGGGEISITSSGNLSMENVSATVASPGATAVTNGRVFKATFTGFTTGAAGTQAFTITNSSFGVGDGVFLTVSNAGTNDAQMRLARVNGQTAGTIIVNTTNEGAAALNGNVVITGWIID